MTDMTMPNMTGETLAKELLRVWPDISIIICTGFSYHMDKEKALARPDTHALQEVPLAAWFEVCTWFCMARL